MTRTKSSQRWLARNAKDKYVQRARQEGARSRATYKLEEIDRRDHVLRPGMVVVDLGAAPGGWSQYARSRVGPSGRVIALDILPMEPISGVEILQGDFTQDQVLDLLMQQVESAETRRGAIRQVDLVMSDMAPNMSGVKSVDQARGMLLTELALDFAAKTLKPDGSLLIKTFQGAGFNEFHAHMRGRFGSLVTRKPPASRTESREIYLLGKGFRSAET